MSGQKRLTTSWCESEIARRRAYSNLRATDALFGSVRTCIPAEAANALALPYRALRMYQSAIHQSCEVELWSAQSLRPSDTHSSMGIFREQTSDVAVTVTPSGSASSAEGDFTLTRSSVRFGSRRLGLFANKGDLPRSSTLAAPPVPPGARRSSNSISHRRPLPAAILGRRVSRTRIKPGSNFAAAIADSARTELLKWRPEPLTAPDVEPLRTNSKPIGGLPNREQVVIIAGLSGDASGAFVEMEFYRNG